MSGRLLEAEARKIILASGLPQPKWNRTLLTQAGALIAIADAYWEEFAVVLEIDSIEWHLFPADYRRTQRRHARLGRYGLRVIPFGPADVESDPDLLIATIRDTLATSTGPATRVRMAPLPASAAA